VGKGRANRETIEICEKLNVAVEPVVSCKKSSGDTRKLNQRAASC